jgi:long-chain acyl-CoA synthetase
LKVEAMTNNSKETVPTIFLKAVGKWGDRVALRKKEYGLWQDITWNDYHEQVKSVACALMSMGLEKGDTAAIIGDNCPEIENSDSRFFFVENEEQLDKWLRFKDNAPELKKVIVWDTEGLRQFKDPMVMTFEALIETGRQAAADYPDLFLKRVGTIEPQDLSVLIYTSGTTGPPKGAMLTHRNCLWMGHAITTDNPMTARDEVMSFLPLCHIFEQLFTVLGHITCGHIVNFIESPDTVAENMMEISPTVGHAVPRIWEKYFSAIQIRMSDATWFKRLVFYSALKIGNKRADLKMNFKAVPFYLEALYQLAYSVVFRKLKERMGFDRLRVAISGAAPIAPEILHFYQSIGDTVRLKVPA